MQVGFFIITIKINYSVLFSNYICAQMPTYFQ